MNFFRIRQDLIPTSGWSFIMAAVRLRISPTTFLMTIATSPRIAVHLRKLLFQDFCQHKALAFGSCRPTLTITETSQPCLASLEQWWIPIRIQQPKRTSHLLGYRMEGRGKLIKHRQSRQRDVVISLQPQHPHLPRPQHLQRRPP